MLRTMIRCLAPLPFAFALACGESPPASRQTIIDTRQDRLEVQFGDDLVSLERIRPGVFEKTNDGLRYSILAGRNGLVEFQRQIQQQTQHISNASLVEKLNQQTLGLNKLLKSTDLPESALVTCTPRPDARVFVGYGGGNIIAHATVYGITYPYVPPDDSYVAAWTSTPAGDSPCSDKEWCNPSSAFSGTGSGSAYAWMECLDKATGIPVYFTAYDYKKW